VHDAAAGLVTWVGDYCPPLGRGSGRGAVRRNTRHRQIRHPENCPPPATPTGYQLLLAQGIPEATARFARTHATWTGPDIGVNDLLVSSADKVWKAQRVPDLEQLLVDRLAAANGSKPWQAFLDLDDELTRIAADADRKLEFHNRYPIAA
jgi:hypothetical protein